MHSLFQHTEQGGKLEGLDICFMFYRSSQPSCQQFKKQIFSCGRHKEGERQKSERERDGKGITHKHMEKRREGEERGR